MYAVPSGGSVPCATCRARGAGLTGTVTPGVRRTMGTIAACSCQRTTGNFAASQPTVLPQVSMGDIPLMVKSTKCSLRGLTPKELIAKGEEAQVQRRTDNCIGRSLEQRGRSLRRRCTAPLALALRPHDGSASEGVRRVVVRAGARRVFHRERQRADDPHADHAAAQPCARATEVCAAPNPPQSTHCCEAKAKAVYAPEMSRKPFPFAPLRPQRCL